MYFMHPILVNETISGSREKNIKMRDVINQYINKKIVLLCD